MYEISPYFHPIRLIVTGKFHPEIPTGPPSGDQIGEGWENIIL